MAIVSNYYAILDAMRTAIAGLGLTFNTVLIPVIVRKLPKEDESLDTLPQIIVCPPNRPKESVPFSTENEALVKYSGEVVLVGAGNRDFSLNILDTWFSYGEQTQALFQWGLTVSLPRTGNLFFAELFFDAPFDREKLNKSYNYSGFGFKFWVAEKRTN